MAKIFVVDDEKENLTILDIYLKQRGFQTFLCNNSQQAFDLILKEQPDLVILDIMMPEVDGFTVCKQIKSHGETSDIPVIFLTARYLDKKDLIHGLSLGAFDYITKPFDEGELFARINAALRVRLAERSLKERNILFESVLLHMSEALFFLAHDKTILLSNEKANGLLEQYGLFEDKKLLSLGSLSTDEIFKAHMEGNSESISLNLTLGSQYYKLNSNLFKRDSEEGLIITIDNITSELKAQEELIHSAKLVSIGELAASIAHEINNPITGIIGYSELLGLYKDVLPPKVVDICSKIQKESYRVKNIIENLLKFSRRQQLMDMSYVDLAQTLKEVIFLVNTSFEDNNIKLEVDIAQNLPLLYCNSGLIQQALLNLLQNAFDAIVFSKKGTKVEVKVYQKEEKVYIEVADDGPGIPDEIKNKIFEPFFTTKEKGKGTGLGLSLVHRIVELHNGQLQFETSSQGTTFTLAIPIITPKTGQSLLEEKTTDLPSKEGKKVLVIDDDIIIREYLADILYTFKFNVDEAGTYKEGINLLSCNDYDKIIIDVKLPDKDGFEVYRYLEDQKPQMLEKVVFITADVSLDTRERIKKTKCPFLIKPFTFSDLVNTLGLK